MYRGASLTLQPTQTDRVLLTVTSQVLSVLNRMHLAVNGVLDLGAAVRNLMYQAALSPMHLAVLKGRQGPEVDQGSLVPDQAVLGLTRAVQNPDQQAQSHQPVPNQGHKAQNHDLKALKRKPKAHLDLNQPVPVLIAGSPNQGHDLAALQVPSLNLNRVLLQIKEMIVDLTLLI